MHEIDIVSIHLTWDTPWRFPPAPHWLRGALAASQEHNPLFHQHEADRVIYRYPRIHYRWDHLGPRIVGFGEGARSLLDLDWAGTVLQLGPHAVRIREAACSLKREPVGPSRTLIRYRFEAPWLPFDQENYVRFRAMSPREQESELDRLAVAGMLLSMRGLGVDFPGWLYAAFFPRRRQICRYKDVEMLGFWGTLVANAELPDGFAMGRAVSHGHGWLARDAKRRG